MDGCVSPDDVIHENEVDVVERFNETESKRKNKESKGSTSTSDGLYDAELIDRRAGFLEDMSETYRKEYWHGLEELRETHRKHFSLVSERGWIEEQGYNGKNQCATDGCHRKALYESTFCKRCIRLDPKQCLYDPCGDVPGALLASRKLSTSSDPSSRQECVLANDFLRYGKLE